MFTRKRVAPRFLKIIFVSYTRILLSSYLSFLSVSLFLFLIYDRDSVHVMRARLVYAFACNSKLQKTARLRRDRERGMIFRQMKNERNSEKVTFPLARLTRQNCIFEFEEKTDRLIGRINKIQIICITE